MKKSNALATLSWIVPVFCVLLAAAVTYLQFARYKRATGDSIAADEKTKAVQDTLNLASKGSAKALWPYLPATRQEETEFLSRLKTVAQQHGVKLLKWTAVQAATPQPDSNDAKKDEAAVEATPLKGQLEVSGSFDNATAFLNDLLGGNRLLCLDAVKWMRDAENDGTNLSCTITRFVMLKPSSSDSAAQKLPNQFGETK